jgi:hypothetical protein
MCLIKTPNTRAELERRFEWVAGSVMETDLLSNNDFVTMPGLSLASTNQNNDCQDKHGVFHILSFLGLWIEGLKLNAISATREFKQLAGRAACPNTRAWQPEERERVAIPPRFVGRLSLTAEMALFEEQLK